MALGQIRPALCGCLYREVRIEITIFTLRRRNQLNHLVGGFFQRRIGLLAQRPRYSLQPFRHVAVLEHHTVELALFQTRRNAEVGNRVARFGFRHAIVQRIPLIGDHHITYQLLILAKKRVVDFQFVQVGFHYGHNILLRTVRDAGAGRWQCATSWDC